MDPTLASLLNNEEVESVQQEPPKGKKKKKKTSATMRKILAKAEEARNNLIRQKQELLRQTKARVQSEWETNHAKAEIYMVEYKDREKALHESTRKLAEIEKVWENYKLQQMREKEWREYLSCNGLPSPSSMSQMNSYLFVWTELDKNDQISHCIKKTEEVMELLNGLEVAIKDPGPNPPPDLVKDMKELRTEVRRLLQEQIDRATFYLFSRIETDMDPLNVANSKFFATCEYFAMYLWAELYTPIPSSGKAKEIRQPMKITFEEMDITITIPVKLLDIHKVIRVMRLNYDHWSDKCRTYDCPKLPSFYRQTMHDLFVSEFEAKKDLLEYREITEILVKKRIAALPPEPSLSQELMVWGTTPQRALSDEVIHNECEQEDNLGRQVEAILNEFEVNLRRRTFLGGLLLLEVLHQPPQAQCFRLKHCVTLRVEPSKLKLVEFYEPRSNILLEIPEPEEEPDPKKDDQKKKTEETRESRMAEEMKKLVSIQMQLSQEVMWFEKPEPANWDSIHGYWSTEDIHDVDVDEEEGVITFRTGRLGLMGLHVNSYCHFPFEEWLFEPGEDGGIHFYLKTSKTDLHFRIRECKVCLETMEGGRGKAMNWILGKYYSPCELIEHLNRGGINVFPAPDATAYVSEGKSKHVIIEKNIYQIWGMFSKTFRFKRSRFNQIAERGYIVFQAQEIYKNHQVDFCLIQTSMCSCYVLNINEESKVYSPEIAPGMEKCVDLYTLLHKNATGHAKREAAATSHLEIQTVRDFLSSIRPISFS